LPIPKEQVEPMNHGLQLHPDLASAGHGLDPGPGTLHGPLGRPAVEVVADDPLLLPELAGHAGMEMAPEEVKALSPLRRSTTRVLSVEGETEVAQDGGRRRWASSA